MWRSPGFSCFSNVFLLFWKLLSLSEGCRLMIHSPLLFSTLATVFGVWVSDWILVSVFSTIVLAFGTKVFSEFSFLFFLKAMILIAYSVHGSVHGQTVALGIGLGRYPSRWLRHNGVV